MYPPKIFISNQMPGKMEGIQCISTSSLNNKFCEKMSSCKNMICSKCYSRRNLKMYRSARDRYMQNGEILSKANKFEVPTIQAFYVRFNAHGELINTNHLRNLYLIARHNPQVSFVLWTKRVNIVQAILNEKPKNVTLVYSEPRINQKYLALPKGFHKVFATYTQEFAERNNIKINCQKKCLSCLICYNRTVGKGVKFVRELIK